LQGGGLIAYTTNYDEAKRIRDNMEKIFRELTVRILDLSKIEERLQAINLDPDIADFKEGYAIAIGI